MTLIAVVCGYRITGVTGSVTLNGEDRHMDAFRRLSCYITQDDRLQPLLTVTENMQIAADLKLGENVSRKEKNNIVSIIKPLLRVGVELGLQEQGLSNTGGE
jgi:ABC-type multidrug transport system ATPase subunit